MIGLLLYDPRFQSKIPEMHRQEGMLKHSSNIRVNHEILGKHLATQHELSNFRDGHNFHLRDTAVVRQSDGKSGIRAHENYKELNNLYSNVNVSPE